MTRALPLAIAALILSLIGLSPANAQPATQPDRALQQDRPATQPARDRARRRPPQPAPPRAERPRPQPDPRRHPWIDDYQTYRERAYPDANRRDSRLDQRYYYRNQPPRPQQRQAPRPRYSPRAEGDTGVNPDYELYGRDPFYPDREDYRYDHYFGDRYYDRPYYHYPRYPRYRYPRYPDDRYNTRPFHPIPRHRYDRYDRPYSGELYRHRYFRWYDRGPGGDYYKHRRSPHHRGRFHRDHSDD
jgi:hypothetical protein